jgi:hypothetical protein
MSEPAAITVTDLVVTTSSTLAAGGYERVTAFPDWDTTSRRLFEDEYNVVGVAVFQTCADLVRSWPELQGSLVGTISQKVGLSEAKAWDGYLVLLATGVVSEDADLEAVRYDTARLRKLVATGEELGSSGAVERLLRPLLPLGRPLGRRGGMSALDQLPDLLAAGGIARETTTVLVDSFLNQRSLVESLHKSRGPR